MSALAFSPDGKRLAVGMYGQVVLYDAATWLPLGRTTFVEDTVRVLAYKPGSDLLAIGSGLPGRSGRVTLWDTTANTAPSAFSAQADCVEALAWGSSGCLLLGADDNKARLLPAPPGTQGAVLDDHNGRVVSAAISPKENTFFATGGLDKMVKVWDCSTRKAVVNFDQSEAGITGLAFLPNGTTVVGSSLDGRLYWWNVNYDAGKKEFSGNRIRTQNAHEGGVNAFAISGDGARLVTGGEDKAVRVWEAANGRALKTFTDASQPIYAVALAPNGKTAVAAGREGRVYVWSVDDGRLTAIIAPTGLPAPAPAKPTPVKARAEGRA